MGNNKIKPIKLKSARNLSVSQMKTINGDKGDIPPSISCGGEMRYACYCNPYIVFCAYDEDDCEEKCSSLL